MPPYPASKEITINLEFQQLSLPRGEILPDTTQFVLENRYTILSRQNQWAIVGPCRPCIAIIIHDPHTQRTFVAHYQKESNIDDLKPAIEQFCCHQKKRKRNLIPPHMNITLFSENKLPPELADNLFEKSHEEVFADILTDLFELTPEDISHSRVNLHLSDEISPLSFGAYCDVTNHIAINNFGQVFNIAPIMQHIFFKRGELLQLLKSLDEWTDHEKIRLINVMRAVRRKKLRKKYCPIEDDFIRWQPNRATLEDTRKTLKEDYSDVISFLADQI